MTVDIRDLACFGRPARLVWPLDDLRTQMIRLHEATSAESRAESCEGDEEKIDVSLADPRQAG